jgi:uncharacterized protein (TIGR03067 family)
MNRDVVLLAGWMVFVIGAGCLLAGGDEATKKDRQQMAGDWRIASHEKDGKKTPDDVLAKVKVVVTPEGKLTALEGDKKQFEANLTKIDPAKKPKEVDLAIVEGEGKGQTALGIYELEKDSFKLAYAQGKTRPKEFASKPGSGVVLVAYKREEPPKLYANSVGMKFVWLRPGTFVMGSNEKEEGRSQDEVPHKVTLTKGFFMGLHPVTQEQWQAIMGNNPSFFTGDKNLPVEQVSWLDCQEFLKKLQDKDKKPYRLPTEAEWEYACRAGTQTPFHTGESISSDQANYNADIVYAKGKKGVMRAVTTPVGTFPPNAWGLFDMHGNVWEWCQDWYDAYPKDVTDPQGPATGEARVVRGGARYSAPAYCRSAYRQVFLPNYRASYIGVRVCFTE